MDLREVHPDVPRPGDVAPQHAGGASPQCARDAAAPLPRAGVVDLGSNSVRLVVFEGRCRNPVTIFNEKAVLGLGRGLQSTGRLNAAAVEGALTIMGRYIAIARAMGADPIEVLATAAMRDAANGPAFAEALRARMPGVPLRILTGEQEAAMSAEGVLLGVPGADGILGDIGGGSLELVDLANGRPRDSVSLPLGVIRLAERAGGDPVRARAIAEETLAGVPWLDRGQGRDLYLVGGAWRALAKIHITQTGYPLSIVHHYVLRREEARDLCAAVIAAGDRPNRLPGAPAKRLADMPYAAVVLRRLLRRTGARRVVFSANGLREGWYARLLPDAVRERDPLLAAGTDLAERFGRDQAMPRALADWTAPLFPDEPPADAALRRAACQLSDTGSHDHPDYRAEQAFLRVLRQPGVGLDHHARAFLAMTTALRYDAGPADPLLEPARRLLGPTAQQRAERIGAALRLAYTLSGGTPALLAGTALIPRGGRLVLRLVEGTGVFAGESVQRRVDNLAAAMGLEAAVEVAPGPVTAA
ncbi:exopolyphosphatase/guanosine-5'-triphosphate,3'-diphosphate pyrophosphatase [Roseomonas pecuniae]|uniref:Exopolyphosphatase/guanosine-5'-triphosphate, 3'-diphosphate pyrophosphatase n=1 Tax=Muricoccus pecuniae TaxID=693023 RepID=A0A840YJX0_9PROT|nr:exopolyphosphatase/guanosine-5'-triphosphate,3'-diphosphate pyrophosphatase [Roseomonas pecuniae]